MHHGIWWLVVLVVAGLLVAACKPSACPNGVERDNHCAPVAGTVAVAIARPAPGLAG